jgi:ApaG protein
METLTTNGITITVETQYLSSHSSPQHGLFSFAYHITIVNGSPDTVQLLSRHWLIWDSDGRRREVNGAGVVGEQPIIGPGGHFAYHSFCELGTDMGKMSGSYRMERQRDKAQFEVTIPAFRMIVPARQN